MNEWDEIEKRAIEIRALSPEKQKERLDETLPLNDEVERQARRLVEHYNKVEGDTINPPRKGNKFQKGAIIGHYQLDSIIAQGGMGEVWLATDTRKEHLGRKVAFKVMLKEVSSDPELRRRFVAETQILIKLRHPNIVTVYEVDPNGEYMVMEFVEGNSLDQKLKTGKLPLEEALKIAVHAARGLKFIHENNVIHRDIKPSNVMVYPDGHAKILDVGIAKLIKVIETSENVPTVTGATSYTPLPTTKRMILGTPGYMSPEQVNGQKATVQTDIFSLGVLLYEVLEGEKRFPTPKKGGSSEILAAYSEALKTRPPRLQMRNISGPAEQKKEAVQKLQPIVDKALKLSPDERYRSINDMLVALEQARHTKGTNRILLAIWLSILLIVVAAFVVLSLKESPPPVTLGIVTFADASIVEDEDKRKTLEGIHGYLHEAFPESLATNLEKKNSPGLKVLWQSFGLDERNKSDAQAVMGQFPERPSALLTGKVTHNENFLKIQWELLNTSTGESLDRGEYVLGETKLTTVAQKLTERVLGKLGRGSSFTSQLLDETQELSAQAYELYLRGEDAWKQRKLSEAIRYYTRALIQEPKLVAAYVGLAKSLVLLEEYDDVLAPDILPTARDAVEKALEIDKADADAQATRAKTYDYSWANSKITRDIVRKFFEDALKSPAGANSATLHSWYSTFLLQQGELSAAQTHIEAAHKLDKTSVFIVANQARLNYINENYGTVEDLRKKFIPSIKDERSLSPIYRILGFASLKTGEKERAIQDLRKACKFSDGKSLYLSDLGYALAKTGNREEASKILKELIDRHKKGKSLGQHVAAVYAGLAEQDKAMMDEAFKYLKEDFNKQSGLLTEITFRPGFEELRRDSRYTDLIQRMRLLKK